MLHRAVTLLAALALLAAACDTADETVAPEDAATDGAAETGTDAGTETAGTETAGGGELLEGDPDATVVTVLVDSGEFTTLVDALEQAGLDQTLADRGPYTVLAPTDAAFEAMSAAELDRLLADPERLAQVLQSHVAPEELTSDALTDGSRITMLDGTTRTVLVSDDEVLIGPAAVVDADAEASNGVVHAIDLVLSPVPPPEE